MFIERNPTSVFKDIISHLQTLYFPTNAQKIVKILGLLKYLKL